jgi:hypothetical protein
MSSNTASRPPSPDDPTAEAIPAAPAGDGIVFPPFPKMEIYYDGYFRTRITRETAEERIAKLRRSPE